MSGRYKLQGKDGQIIEFREREWENYFGWSGTTRIFEYLDGLKGTIVSGCSAFKKSALIDLGLFDTRIKYLDDILLSLKFYSAGFKSLLDPSLIVMHKIETDEYDLFQKEFNYGSDRANINRIYGKRFAIYPGHWKKLIRCGSRYLFKGDLFAGYQARMLLYNKLGMLAKGLQRGALYL